MAISENNTVISNYHSSISAGLNSCFLKGKYKYLNLDGTYKVVEFPLDQFNSALANMQDYIKEGKVFGVFNPLLAGQMFKPSLFTFNQVKNIALSGMIDELTADIDKEEILSPSDIGLSPIIATALIKIDKEFFSNSDLKQAYEQVRDFWASEKIMRGFLFKKEVDLVDELKIIDEKCMLALMKSSYEFLLSKDEIIDIVADIKSKKYVEYLKNIIDDPDIDEKISAKMMDIAKNTLEERKKFKFCSLYKDALKSLKNEDKKQIKTEEKSGEVAKSFIKRFTAVVLVLLGYYSFFDANFLENKMRPINEYATKIMTTHSNRFNDLFNAVNINLKDEFKPLSTAFSEIGSTVMIAKIAFSTYTLILDFGTKLFFQFLVPFVFLLCSLYFAFGCKSMISGKILRLAKVFFVFAMLLRFFTPVNGYLMAKSDEYIFYSKYAENEKLIGFFNEKYNSNDKDVKKIKAEQIELSKDIVKNSGETIGIILIQSLFIPLIAFILLKKLLCFK